MVDNLHDSVTILLKQFMCDHTYDCGYMSDGEDACKNCKYKWNYDGVKYHQAEVYTMVHLALEDIVDDDLKQDVLNLYKDKYLKVGK